MPTDNCNRLFILSIFDKNGIVDDYVFCVINFIRAHVRKIIVVINGVINSYYSERLNEVADIVLVRENKGFDAGAYHHVLVDILEENEIRRYDEIILCNDTFYGPFNGFDSMFGKMDKEECDFWGISGYFYELFPHIQSYFLVFRKKIIEDGSLIHYFRDYIDPETLCLNDVYAQFEKGLFDYLVRIKKRKYAVYTKPQSYSIYDSAVYHLRENGLPIIKKKCFDVSKYSINDILCSLKFIKKKSDYDIDLIISSVKRLYGLCISYDDIDKSRDDKLSLKKEVLYPLNSIEDIEEFINNDFFYIYGAGMFGCQLYWRIGLNNSRFLGFIVSDPKDAGGMKYGYKIKCVTDVKDLDRKIIIATNPKTADEIEAKFSNKENLMRIY